jgi:hypothetical protein
LIVWQEAWVYWESCKYRGARKKLGYFLYNFCVSAGMIVMTAKRNASAVRNSPHRNLKGQLGGENKLN